MAPVKTAWRPLLVSAVRATPAEYARPTLMNASVSPAKTEGPVRTGRTPTFAFVPKELKVLTVRLI